MIEKIKLLANQGMYPTQISKELSISYDWALILYKRCGFTLEGSGGKNKKVLINPFNDNDESNYWLGFLSKHTVELLYILL